MDGVMLRKRAMLPLMEGVNWKLTVMCWWIVRSSRGHSLDSDGGGASGPHTSGPNYQSWFGIKNSQAVIILPSRRMELLSPLLLFWYILNNRISFYISSSVETVLTLWHLTHIVKLRLLWDLSLSINRLITCWCAVSWPLMIQQATSPSPFSFFAAVLLKFFSPHILPSYLH